jgi:hypothetical protein
MVDWVGVAGRAVGVVGTGYGIGSDVKQKGVQQWVHMALVNLKPGIQGENRDGVLAAINNMLEFLQPPKKRKSNL